VQTSLEYFACSGHITDVGAALNKVELLCQDEWDISEGKEQLQVVDQLAQWTLHADAMYGQLRRVFEQGTSVQVPPMVRHYAQRL
jgi:hypothetical protein